MSKDHESSEAICEVSLNSILDSFKFLEETGTNMTTPSIAKVASPQSGTVYTGKYYTMQNTENVLKFSKN